MKKSQIGYFIIGSALFWGIAMITCALQLKGFDQKDTIIQYLGLFASLHLILIWGPLAVHIKKIREQDKEPTVEE